MIDTMLPRTLRLAAAIGTAVLTATFMLTATVVPVHADSGALVTYKSLTPEVALEAAQAALKTCRDNGYQVAVVVVDRFGQPQVLLRDRFAGLPAADTATRKAYTALSFRSDTSSLARSIRDGQMAAGLGTLPHVAMVGGGVLIEAAGSPVGGIGVSGAPGGNEDETCARAGLDAIREKIEF